MIRIALIAAMATAGPAGGAFARLPERTTASWHPDTGRYCIRWSRRDAAAAMGERLYLRECRSEAAWRTLGVRFTRRVPAPTAT